MVRGGGPARRRAGERERVTRRACRARGRGMERRQGLCTAAARRRFDRNGLTNSVPPTRPLRPLWSLGRCPSHSVRVIPSDLHPSHCFPCHAVRVESEPPMSESKSPPVGSDMARATTTPAVTQRMAVCLDGRAAGVVAGFGPAPIVVVAVSPTVTRRLAHMRYAGATTNSRATRKISNLLTYLQGFERAGLSLKRIISFFVDFE